MKCPKCKTKLLYEANFCHKCGQALGSKGKQSKSNVTPKSERRRITALFSDLSGYSAMTKKLDPEEVKEITSDIFDGIRGVASKYEGFIERFEGDGVLILFGVPRAHEDDPIRAIRAAWDIHHYVEALNPRYQAKVVRPLSMHSGINTGLAVTGDNNKETGTYGVTGESVNKAARLSDLAEAGDVLVGAGTYRAARNHFTFNDMGYRRVKGASESIRVYKLLSFKAPASTANTQISSEMIGREREMAMLESQIRKAINGAGSIVNVIGEAGIGKSRLIAELKRKDLMKSVTLLEGRAISIGKNLSFHPIIDFLKHWARIGQSDSESDTLNKLEKFIRAVHPGGAEEILPFIATLMGLELSGRYAERVKGIEGEALEKMILKNLRDFLIKATDLNPLVIVIEDLHWADTSSLEILISLCNLVKTRKIVFINVFRSGHKETGDRIAETIREEFPEHSIEIVLQALDDNMSAALIYNMVKIRGYYHPVIEEIVQRAGGNPFFIEEVVWSFIDEGALVINNGVFDVTKKMDKMTVPQSINDVLMARIDRLEEETRDLIKIASVIGRTFFYRILAEVAKTIKDIKKRLDYLLQIQLIQERRRLDESEYVFKHALVQETVYESILLEKRKELHNEIGRSIETAFKDRLHEFYGMLAYHYSMGDNEEKAEEYLIKAGKEALRSSASREALHYFQDALELYLNKYGQNTDTEKLVILEKNIAMAFYNIAEWQESVKYLDNVLKRLGSPLPKRGAFGVLKLMCNMLVLLKAAYWKLPNSKNTPGKRDIEIHELYYRAAEALVYVDNIRQFEVVLSDFKRIAKFDLIKIPKLWGFWAALAVMFSFSRLSYNLSNRLLEVSSQFRNQQDVVDRLRYAAFSGLAYNSQGAWEEIQELDWDLVNSSLEFGELFHITVYLWDRGLVKLEQGNFNHLMMIIDKMYKIGEAYGYIYCLANSHGLKTQYFISRGSASEALSEAEKVVSCCRQLNFGIGEMAGMAYKSMAQLLAEDLEGARDTVLQASGIYKTQSSMLAPPVIAPFIMVRFLISVKELKSAIDSEIQSDVASIRKYTYEVGNVAVKNSRKYAPYRTKILGLMGEYHWLLGKQGQALKWWAKAIKEGERLGARPDLSRTYFEVGKSLLDPKSKHKKLDGIEAREYLEKARILFEEMGLELDLEQLDRTTQAS